MAVHDAKDVSNKLNAVFTLVSSIKDLIREAKITEAMTLLVKALMIYVDLPILKKEKELLEEQFYELELKVSQHANFVNTYGPVSFVQGEHKMAIDFLSQLLDLEPQTFEEKMAQVMELIAGESFAEALEKAQALYDEPEMALERFLAVGDEFLRRGRWEEAKNVYNAAYLKHPESPNLLNRMGISHRKSGEYKQALEYYRKACLLSPDDENLYFNVARLLLDWGKKEKAREALARSLKLNPRFEQALKLKEEIGGQEEELV